MVDISYRFLLRLPTLSVGTKWPSCSTQISRLSELIASRTKKPPSCLLVKGERLAYSRECAYCYLHSATMGGATINRISSYLQKASCDFVTKSRRSSDA